MFTSLLNIWRRASALCFYDLQSGAGLRLAAVGGLHGQSGGGWKGGRRQCRVTFFSRALRYIHVVSVTKVIVYYAESHCTMLTL